MHYPQLVPPTPRCRAAGCPDDDKYAVGPDGVCSKCVFKEQLDAYEDTTRAASDADLSKSELLYRAVVAEGPQLIERQWKRDAHVLARAAAESVPDFDDLVRGVGGGR